MAAEDLSLRLCYAFLADHPEAAAQQLEAQPAEDAAALLGSAGPEAAATVLGTMSPNDAAACLALLPPESAERILEELPLERTANLMRRLADDARASLLQRMDWELREPLESLLRYPQGSVGAAMDPTAFALPGDLNVESATERIRRNASRIRYYLYIIDRSHRLIGVLNLRDFILAEPGQLLRDIMNRKVEHLRPNTRISELEAIVGGTSFRSMPVVGDEERFLGVFSFERYQAGAARKSPMGTSAWDTIVALSELYWVGLSGMLGSAPAPAPDQPDDADVSDDENGGSNGS